MYVGAKNMKHNGFTLIEMLIVVAILGIVLAVAFPSYQQLIAKQALIDQAEEMVQTINAGRVAAFTQKKPVYLSAKTTVADDAVTWCYGTNYTASCDCADTSCSLSVKQFSDANTTAQLNGLSANDVFIDPVRGLLNKSVAVMTLTDKYNQVVKIEIAQNGTATRVK